jgi:hydrogenase/urease accessory protein HupE
MTSPTMGSSHTRRRRITGVIIYTTLNRRLGNREGTGEGGSQSPCRVLTKELEFRNNNWDGRAKAMKSIGRSVEIRFGLGVSLLLMMLFANRAQAHDPGLSSANVTVGSEQVDVLLGFAQKDAESMVGAGINAADTDPLRSFAAIQPKLESVAKNEFSLYYGKLRAIPNEVKARSRDAQNIEISLRFQRPNRGQVLLVSALFERLPLGHRQFLSVQTTMGADIGQVMLSAKENSFQIDLPGVAANPVASNKSDSFFPFLKLGVEHIWLGVDHLLFVFGLLLLVKSRWMLFKTVTAFTVAHSITLAMATLGYAHLPGPALNAAIALSILILGLEIVRSRGGGTSITTLHPWTVAFAFGLLHGFGFASGLSALGLPAAHIPLALVTFNVGVEIGQVSFVLLILLLERSFRQLEIRWPRWVQVLPGYTVGSLGAFWTVQRAATLLGIIP